MTRMRVPMFQVDAFAHRPFTGNPAAVMLLPHFPGAATLQAIAAENNLSETAFLVRDGDDYRLRWFTPKVEVPLCGHGTLASAAVVMERLEPARRDVVFHTASGPLRVQRRDAGYAMDFPMRHLEPVAAPPDLAAALGVEPIEVAVDAGNYTARLADAATVRALAPDFAALARLDRTGIVVTAAGDGDYDFTSRYFAPRKGVPEDPVTGGAHCGLAPFWAARLGKREFRAWQASPRGGEVVCRWDGERVALEGRCVFFFEGEARFEALEGR
jgi:PhzF family phenazine biosynthesis protein